MSKSGFQLTADAAIIYEQQKVPAMFGPLADITLKAINLSADDEVIDIACGTGIVARKVSELIGTKSRIVGVDLNEPMIKTAKSLQDEYSQACEWHIADATSLPFDDNEFSLALCQQGIQFIPDKQGVINEAYRVIRPSGRFVLTVWSGVADFMLPIIKSIHQHVSFEAAEKAKEPFGYDATTLVPLLKNAGFMDINVSLITVDRTIAATKQAIQNEIMGMPFAPLIKEKGDAVVDKIIQDALTGLAKHLQGQNFIIPQHTHLIQATR